MFYIWCFSKIEFCVGNIRFFYGMFLVIRDYCFEKFVMSFIFNIFIINEVVYFYFVLEFVCVLGCFKVKKIK